MFGRHALGAVPLDAEDVGIQVSDGVGVCENVSLANIEPNSEDVTRILERKTAVLLETFALRRVCPAWFCYTCWQQSFSAFEMSCVVSLSKGTSRRR
jgi:hypothetical protein